MHESITKQDRNNINDPQKKHRLGTVSKNILLEGLNRFNSAPTSPLVQIYSISREVTQSIIYTFYSNVSAVYKYYDRFVFDASWSYASDQYGLRPNCVDAQSVCAFVVRIQQISFSDDEAHVM